MVDATDFFLNTMVVLTTLVVMYLVYESTDDMLSPILALQQEAQISVEVLSKKCSNVWKNTRHEANPALPLIDEPNYDTEGFCQRLPADLSASYLWNEHLDWILQASSNEQDISSHLVTSKLLHFLTPAKYLDLGHRSRPSRQAWGRLLDRIEARMKSNSAPMVRIAVFGAGSKNCNVVEPGADPTTTTQSQDIDCLWPIRLEVFLNNILNHHQPPSQKRAIINVFPIYNPGLPVTVEFATAIIKNQLWNQRLLFGGPDVILTAFNANDMFLPKRGWKTAEDIDYYHHQREVFQDYIRSSLLSKRCNQDGQRDPPIVISVDNYVGNQHGPVMAENVQARVLQLLSDYYETAFVSYAEVIRKLVYASDNNRSPLLHTSLKEWTGDWQNINQQKDTIEHGFLGPIAMTLTLAYSFLRYTVSYCHDKASSEQDYSIIPEEIFQITENVPPPELNTNLTLSEVSDRWNAEKPIQSNLEAHCSMKPDARPKPCAFAFWGGSHQKAALQEYLLGHARMVNWEIDTGKLAATQNGATIHFTFNVLPEQTNWKITIFSTRRDSEATPSIKLEWHLSNDSGRRRLQQHGNHTIIQSRRRLADASSGIIEGTHDSPHTMVLPTYIPVDQSLLEDEIHFKMKLVEGDSFEILAMMFCSEDN